MVLKSERKAKAVAVIVAFGLAFGLTVTGCQTTLKELVDLNGQFLNQVADFQKKTGTEVVGTAVLDPNLDVGLVEAVTVRNPSRITLTMISKGKPEPSSE